MSAQDIDEKFRPVQTGELDDLHLLPGEFRAFRREMRDCLESISRTLQSLSRIEERLDIVIDRQNVLEERVVSIEQRVSALEKTRKKPKKRK